MSRRKKSKPQAKGSQTQTKHRSKRDYTKFEFCLECEEVTEIQFDANLKEYFCKECGTTTEDEMINLPDSVKKGSGASSGYQGGTTCWGGGGNYTACDHKGDKVIFESNGKQLYAANSKGIDEYSGKWELILDLGQIIPLPSAGFIKESNAAKFIALRQYTGKYTSPKSEILRLDWPDMSAPAVVPDFWTELWKIMPEKTCIVCIGGHGRTGTCLASFMIAVGGMDYYTAFATVRSEHCEKAIESLTQARYLHGLYVDMLKRRLTESTAKGDIVATADVQKDLDFASKHQPTASDLLGGDDPQVEISTSAKGYNSQQKLPMGGSGTQPQRQCISCNGWCNYASTTRDWYCYTCRKVAAVEGQVQSNPVNDPTKLDDGKDFEQPRIKRVAGTLYIKECMDPACAWAEKEECDDPDHQAWVKWDDYQYMEARVS